jgi:hypothetical protein
VLTLSNKVNEIFPSRQTVVDKNLCGREILALLVLRSVGFCGQAKPNVLNAGEPAVDCRSVRVACNGFGLGEGGDFHHKC